MRKLTLLLCLLATAVAQDSLADRARKVRGESTVPQKSMGRIQNRDYINDQLGFTFTHIDGWETVTRGQINVNQALGRSALGLSGRVSSDAHEFMFNDGNGQNIVLSISPIPPGTDRATFGDEIRKALKIELPKAEVSDEPTTLGDAQHQFQTCRVTYEALGTQIYQSSHAMILGNYFVHFVITATSPEALTDTVREAQKHLIWKPAA
jgi:hypothetical protein